MSMSRVRSYSDPDNDYEEAQKRALAEVAARRAARVADSLMTPERSLELQREMIALTPFPTADTAMQVLGKERLAQLVLNGTRQELLDATDEVARAVLRAWSRKAIIDAGAALPKSLAGLTPRSQADIKARRTTNGAGAE